MTRKTTQIKNRKFSSVYFTQSCPSLWDPMDSSMPGFPVHHQLQEITQTHVHHFDDAIQPSHYLSSPSHPAFNHSQHQGIFPMSWFFTSGGQSIGVPASTSVLPMNAQDWYPLGMFCNFKKERDCTICYNMAEPWEHHTKWNKLVKKDKCCMISQIWVIQCS